MNAGGMKRAARIVSVLVSCSSVLGGCALFDAGIDVRVAIPPVPRSWMREFGGMRFSLFYPDGDGCLQWMDVPDRETSVRISCSKMGNSPVLAYPWRAAAEGTLVPRGSLKPAGGLFPRNLRRAAGGVELVLSWEDGAAAEVFRALLESGTDTDLVNGERLADRIAEASDPWALDLGSIAQCIASGDFNAYDIDPLPAADVRLSVPEGEWLLENPFRPVQRAGPEGTLLLQGLSFGLHHVFGCGRRLDVFLDARGAAVDPY